MGKFGQGQISVKHLHMATVFIISLCVMLTVFVVVECRTNNSPDET